MKKLTVFIILVVLFAIATLLLNRHSPKKSGGPTIVHGNPYAGGPGGGSASAGYTGRIDGSDAKR
jgi:hypothetical protein